MNFRSSLLLGAALSAVAPAAPAVAQAQKPVRIERAWSRATPRGAQTGAVYLTITNDASSADRLLGGSSPAAKEVQLHRMHVSSGIMRMRQVEGGLPIPAGASLSFAPGSYHLMLVGLKAPLKAGSSVEMTLDFQNAGKIDVNAPILPIGAKGPSQGPMKRSAGAGAGMKMEMR